MAIIVIRIFKIYLQINWIIVTHDLFIEIFKYTYFFDLLNLPVIVINHLFVANCWWCVKNAIFNDFYMFFVETLYKLF